MTNQVKFTEFPSTSQQGTHTTPRLLHPCPSMLGLATDRSDRAINGHIAPGGEWGGHAKMKLGWGADGGKVTGGVWTHTGTGQGTEAQLLGWNRLK